MNSRETEDNGESAGFPLQIILDVSPVGITVFDQDARVLYANALAERLFNRKVSSGPPVPCSDFIGCGRVDAAWKGCSHTRHCQDCQIFKAISGICAPESGQSLIEAEAFLDRKPGLADLWIKYRVVPALIDSRKVAVMAIEDITEAKANERELNSALTELSIIHDHAPIAMILLDRDRRVHKANGFAAKFADRRTEDMIGLKGGEALRCLHHLDDPQGCGFGKVCAECRVRQAVLDTFDTGTSREEVEAWLPFPGNGSTEERCLLISTAFLKIGGTERVLVCAQDITDRKRVQQALQQSEKQYRSLFNSIRDAILVADTNRRIIGYNQAFIDLFGYPSEEILGKNTRVIYGNKEEYDRMAEAIQDHIGDPSFLHTIEYKKKDGSVFPGETSVFYLLDDEGNISGFIGLIRDISERVRAEEAMRLRTRAIESAIDGIAILDEKETYVYLNLSHAQLYGYDRPEELIGKSWRVLYNENELKRFDREIMPDFRKQGFWRGEATGLKKDGTVFPQEISLTSLPDNGLICVVRDISDRIHALNRQKDLEAQLNQSQKMESVGRLAGGVAHDYNNMLNVIIGYTEMALDKTGPDDPLYGDLAEVLSAARRSADITRQLLGFARRQTTDPKVMDLNDTVGGTLKMLRRLIGEDIDLSWQPGPGDMSVFMDPSQVDQILANLCVNARDAIDGVGKVTIETGHVRFDGEYCLDHAGFIPGDFIMLAVSDDGCGMDKTTVENVFEPFFTTKGVGKGTGLGLSTVYGIVKQNNGFINVYSEPEKGTAIKIYLPPQSREQGPEKAKETRETPVGKGETVLIVEDEPSILTLVQRFLKRLEYNVLTASTPKNAAAVAEEHDGRIDLLITDVVMPGMNGRELAENLRTRYPRIKVLFMSGYSANAIAHHGVLDPGVNFIQKPFTNQDLAVKVKEALKEC